MNTQHLTGGDFGWNDADDAPAWTGIGSAAVLLASSAAYVACVWLAHGLPPLPRLASRMRDVRPAVTS
jgi:hypothetical protein